MGFRRVDAATELAASLRRGQSRQRHRMEVGVAVELGAIGKGELERLGEQVNIGRRVVSEGTQLVSRESVQDRRHDPAARARRRHAVDVAPVEATLHRFPPNRPVAIEIARRQHSTALHCSGDDRRCDFTSIKAGGTVATSLFQGTGEVGLAKRLALPARRAVLVQEDPGELGVPRDLLRAGSDRLR